MKRLTLTPFGVGSRKTIVRARGVKFHIVEYTFLRMFVLFWNTLIGKSPNSSGRAFIRACPSGGN